MLDLGCMLVESRPFVVLDRLPGLYGLKYDSATASGLLLYLCSYKLDRSATVAQASFWWCGGALPVERGGISICVIRCVPRQRHLAAEPC